MQDFEKYVIAVPHQSPAKIVIEEFLVNDFDAEVAGITGENYWHSFKVIESPADEDAILSQRGTSSQPFHQFAQVCGLILQRREDFTDEDTEPKEDSQE